MDDNQNMNGQNQPDSFEDRMNKVNQEPAPAVNQPAPLEQLATQEMPGTPTATPPEPRTMASDMGSGASPTYTPQGMDDGGPVFSPNTNSQSAGGAMLEPEIRTGGHKAIWWIGGICRFFFLFTARTRKMKEQ